MPGKQNSNDMKDRINDIWKRLAVAILGLLGFASCQPLLMYGSPYAEFKALGTVKDETGKPIEGIRVAVRQHQHYNNTAGVKYDHNDIYIDDTLYTDAKGAYLLNRSVFRGPDDVTIVFEDIDGEAHGGEYSPAEAQPKVTMTEKGSGSWFQGAYEAKADVTLKKQ
jgi:putative lipoprotein (rSAM/lipoprotein system)